MGFYDRLDDQVLKNPLRTKYDSTSIHVSETLTYRDGTRGTVVRSSHYIRVHNMETPLLITQSRIVRVEIQGTQSTRGSHGSHQTHDGHDVKSCKLITLPQKRPRLYDYLCERCWNCCFFITYLLVAIPIYSRYCRRCCKNHKLNALSTVNNTTHQEMNI